VSVTIYQRIPSFEMSAELVNANMQPDTLNKNNGRVTRPVLGCYSKVHPRLLEEFDLSYKISSDSWFR
jgi:hypothetical protein